MAPPATPCAPILLLVYNRPEHTERLLRELQSQPEASRSPLIIYSDGAKGSTDRIAVEQVRVLVHAIEGFESVVVVEQPVNRGLAANVVAGVEAVLQRYDRVIVLEDDLTLAPSFLSWINAALEAYAAVERVAHVHAGTFFASEALPEGFLSHFVGSWGWGTWRRAWRTYWESDGALLYRQITSERTLRRAFNYGGTVDFVKMLRRQVSGHNNSWAIRWHASLLLHDRLSYNAGRPLAAHRGGDGSGTHFGSDRRFERAVSEHSLRVLLPESIEEDLQARQVLMRYYARHNNKLAKAYYKLRGLWHHFRKR